MASIKVEKTTLIVNPGARLKRYIPLRFVRAHGAGKKSGYAELNLTSMVDMLTILVVFLLQTFSASGELVQVNKNIVLPEAQNFAQLEMAPNISISHDAVALDGRMVANAAQLNTEDTTDWKITDLHDQLVMLKNNYKLIHPSTPFTGTVIVQADKNVDFKVVKKVMYSAALAGYGNVNFAIQQRGKAQ